MGADRDEVKLKQALPLHLNVKSILHHVSRFLLRQRIILNLPKWKTPGNKVTLKTNNFKQNQHEKFRITIVESLYVMHQHVQMKGFGRFQQTKRLI